MFRTIPTAILLGAISPQIQASSFSNTYYLHNAIFNDGARLEGYLTYDLISEAVVDLEFTFYAPTDPQTETVFFPEETVIEPYYYFDQFPDEPQLDVWDENYIDFQSDTLIQLGSPESYLNFQLDTSMTMGSDTITITLADEITQGSYQISSQPLYWGFPGYTLSVCG
ncbi:MAG: hypothetical protein ACPGN3_05555 [Opitutales bacterium]